MTSKHAPIIIINQTIHSQFADWVISLANSLEQPIELWTNNPPDNNHPNLVIRHLPKYSRQSALSRLITWLYCSIVIFWLLLWRPRNSIILGVTNPPFMPMILHSISKIRAFRYILLEYDIYPQIMRAMNIVSDKNWLYRIWYRWHSIALNDATRIITLADGMAHTLQKMTHQPIIVIPTWTDTEQLQPIPRKDNIFVQNHQLEDKFVVLYSGNLGATHAIETIIAVAQELVAQADIKFVIVGDGSKRPLIEDAITQGTLPNVLLLPYQAQDMLPYSLSCSHIAIVTLADGYETLSMPSKTYDMMAVGNAILGISNTPSTLSDIIEKHQCGATFSSEAILHIVKWIQEMQQSPEKLNEMRHAARLASEQHYSGDIVRPQLTRAITEIAKDLAND